MADLSAADHATGSSSRLENNNAAAIAFSTLLRTGNFGYRQMQCNHHQSCRTAGKFVCISYLDIRCESAMAKSTVFTSNRSQAVRLPKAVAFPEDVHQVEIIKIGRSRLITPVGHRWDDLFLNGPRATEDFMSERDQGVAEEREPF
jgi:antitoxin VapB